MVSGGFRLRRPNETKYNISKFFHLIQKNTERYFNLRINIFCKADTGSKFVYTNGPAMQFNATQAQSLSPSLKC